MKESKLISTLQLFSKDELIRIDKYLNALYFPKDKNQDEICLLFKYLLQEQANWNGLERVEIYNYVFNNQKIVKGKLDKLMSGLLREIHRYIIQNRRYEQEDRTLEYITLANFFEERNAENFSDYFLKKARKNFNNLEVIDSDYFQNGFSLAKKELQQQLINEKQKGVLDYNRAMLSLDAYYLLNRLDWACSLLSYYRFRKKIDVASIIDLLDGIKPYFAAQGTLNIPIIDLYYRAYEMLKTEGQDESAYWELKTGLLANEKTISFESLKILWGVARNFMIRRINTGEFHILEELFALHKEHLEKKYLDFGNGILSSTLKNIVTLGLKVKEFDWVYAFLETYRYKIKGFDSPEDVYLFNLANYYFALERFDDALDILADRYEDIHYKMVAKRMEIKIYYELKSEILDSKIDAFKIFIYRLPEKNILDYKRRGNNNFIDVLRQLRNPKTSVNNSRYDKLFKRIKEIKQLDERDWLLEKLKESKIN